MKTVAIVVAMADWLTSKFTIVQGYVYLHKTKQIRIIIDDTLYRQADNNLQNFELICEVSFNCKSRLNDIQY